jgi:hypothetical protein
MAEKPMTCVINTASSGSSAASAIGAAKGPSTAGTPGWVVTNPIRLAPATRAAKLSPGAPGASGSQPSALAPIAPARPLASNRLTMPSKPAT